MIGGGGCRWEFVRVERAAVVSVVEDGEDY
jgi:hypothetical protein